MTDTAQVPLKPETLAQKSAAEIRERITELSHQIEALDDEISQINAAMLGNWRHAAENPKEAERVAEDLEKAHRRRRLFQQVREKAEADLRAAERQIVLDRFAEKRGAFETIMQQRTKRARDVVSTVQMLAAVVEEIHTLGRQAIMLFSTDASDGGISFNEALKTINKVFPQPHIDTMLGAWLDRGLWEVDTDRRAGPGYVSDYPAAIDAERTALMVELGSAARRVAVMEAQS